MKSSTKPKPPAPPGRPGGGRPSPPGGAAGGAGCGGAGTGAGGKPCCPEGDEAIGALAKDTGKKLAGQVLKAYEPTPEGKVAVNNLICAITALQRAKNLPSSAPAAIKTCLDELITMRNNPGNQEDARVSCIVCCMAIMAAACGKANVGSIGCEGGCSEAGL